MKSVAKFLAISLIFSVPASAIAQLSADVAYCNALSAKYRETKTSQADEAVAAAMGQCTKDPAAGIPVLEKHLTNAKVPLPPRS